jgi:hypothetical protein
MLPDEVINHLVEDIGLENILIDNDISEEVLINHLFEQGMIDIDSYFNYPFEDEDE